MSHALCIEDVSEGGHGGLDSSYGDVFGAEFDFTEQAWALSESFHRLFLGKSEESKGCHPCGGRCGRSWSLYDVSF